jgi:hypothetical protein
MERESRGSAAAQAEQHLEEGAARELEEIAPRQRTHLPTRPPRVRDCRLRRAGWLGSLSFARSGAPPRSMTASVLCARASRRAPVSRSAGRFALCSFVLRAAVCVPLRARTVYVRMWSSAKIPSSPKKSGAATTENNRRDHAISSCARARARACVHRHGCLSACLRLCVSACMLWCVLAVCMHAREHGTSRPSLLEFTRRERGPECMRASRA